MNEPDTASTENDFSFLLDLLSHDVLNNNQAVLSYLELINSSHDTDQRTREYVEKAISQLHTNSMLIDGTKRLLTAIKDGPMSLEPVNALMALKRASTDLAKVFPQRRIDVDLSAVDPRAELFGGMYVQHLLNNLLNNAVQLDTGEEIRMVAACGRDELRGEGRLLIRISAPTVALPAGIDKDILSRSGAPDISKVARVSGLVVAGRIARLLGGGLRCEPTGTEEGQGCIFEVALKGVLPA